MSTYAWLDDLNAPQREAVTGGDGPMLVIAGAGTGKTKTLAYRVAYLVCEGIDPSRILLLTFTRRAAQEMLQRAAAILREARPDSADGANRVWGGTFHATANRLLRMYADQAGMSGDFTVMDQSDARDLINVVRQELGYHSKEKRFPRKGTLLDAYSHCVNGQAELVDVLGRHYPWCLEWESQMREIFKAYDEGKAKRNVVDYDDLLTFWSRLVENEAIAESMCERFDHVLVDEYQDTNMVQAHILEGMRIRNRNIMVVGDDAQSIYGFRAARVENILDFPKQFEGTRQVTLEQNYRSLQPILDVANAVISKAKRQHRKALWSERASEERPKLMVLFDEHQQSDFVIERVLEHLEAGIPLRQQAVLFRTGHWSDALEVELNRRNIPYHKYGGLKFLEAAHVKDFLSFLRVLENPRDQIAWFRLLNLLEGVGPKTAWAVYEEVQRQDLRFGAVADGPGSAKAKESLAALGALLTKASEKAKTSDLAGQVALIRGFYEPILQRVYDAAGARGRDLEQLETIAGRYESRERFLTDLTLDPPTSTSDLAGPPTLDEDWLVLSTIHSAKGCEWDVVYMIHAVDGIIPSDLSTGDVAAIEEERRLLYVALTRAKDDLYVTMPLKYYFTKHKRGDGHAYAQLTRFVDKAALGLFDQVDLSAEGQADGAPGVSARVDVRASIQGRWD